MSFLKHHTPVIHSGILHRKWKHCFILWGLCHNIALPGPESKNRSVRPLDWIWAYFRILPNFFGSAKKREGGGQILGSECTMLGMDGYHIISSKRELVQVAGYSKVNLKAKYSSYLWLDEFIFYILKIMKIQTPENPYKELSSLNYKKRSCFKLKIILLAI